MVWVEAVAMISCDDGVEFVRVNIIYTPDEWRGVGDKITTLDNVKVLKE